MGSGTSVQHGFPLDDRVGSAKRSGMGLLLQPSLIGQSKLVTKLHRERGTLLEYVGDTPPVRCQNIETLSRQEPPDCVEENLRRQDLTRTSNYKMFMQKKMGEN